MQNINDLSSSQICTLAIYHSCFTDGATMIHICRMNWLQLLSALRTELKYPPKLIMNHYYYYYHHYYAVGLALLLSYPCGSAFCSLAGRGIKVPPQQGHLCSLTACPPGSDADLTRLLFSKTLTCTCAVAIVEPKGFFVSLLFPFFFFFNNLNKECSGLLLRDFWAPFQNLPGLLSLTCN